MHHRPTETNSTAEPEECSLSDHNHSVQFYDSDDFLSQTLGRFVQEGLDNNEGIFIIATTKHLEELRLTLEGRGIITKSYETIEQLALLNAEETLEFLTQDNSINLSLLENMISTQIEKMLINFSKIRVYGEMVNLLIASGRTSDTLILEAKWTEFIARWPIKVMCGYAMDNFSSSKNSKSFGSICRSHSAVIPSENYSGPSTEEAHLRIIAELQQKTLSLHSEIEERKLAESYLNQSREELRIAKELAEQANFAKTRFLANMSHEIRSPLNSILGFTELMRDPDLSTEDRERYANVIDRNGLLLATLISHILDMSKADTSDIDIEFATVDISSIIDDVVSHYQPEAKSKNLLVIVSEPPEGFPRSIHSDPIRIHQILSNLIGNAIKFTEQGEIEISFSLLPRSNQNSKDIDFDQIGVRVSDTGIGLSKKQRTRLFQCFEQLDSSTTRKYGGTGLGLVLSKKLAQALGGDLILEYSEPNLGSQFLAIFNINDDSLFKNEEIDLFQETDDVLNAKLFHMKPLNGIRILVAEDGKDNQLLIDRLLCIEGAAVDIANNGVEAVTKAKSNDYDLVLMDIMMPLCDGYEASRQLRNQGFSKPIIALTAHALKEDRERSIEAGCDDHLTKPINRKALVQIISKAVGKSAKRIPIC